MAYITSKSAVVYVTEETTSGVAVDPTLATQAIAINSLEMNLARETIDRSVLKSSISKSIPLNGMRSCSGSVVVEAKAHGTAGTATEYDLLLQSALAGKRTIATTTTSKATGNTTSVLAIEDADITKFHVGDVVMIKESGDYWVSPIASIVDTAGSATITLLRVRGTAFSASVVVDKLCQYYGANSSHKSVTITEYLEDAIKKQAVGCMVTGLNLENFSVGQIPSFNVSFDGFDLTESVASSGLTASYNTATPPVCLSACVYMDGTSIAVSELSASIANTIGKVTSTCASNGIISARVSERAVSGSFTTYADTASVANYTKFSAGTTFSLLLYAGVPTATAGQFKDVVAVFIPVCLMTNKPHADADGIVTEQIEFSAGYSSTYASDIFIATI